MLGEQPRGGAAAGDEHLELVAVAHALAVVVAVDEVFVGGDTLLDLVDAGAFHVAGDGEHASAGRGLAAELLVGVGAVLEHPRQVRERLDVVHDRGLAVEADGGREERRLEAGHAPVAFEALDECGLFADDVGARTPVQDDVDREVRSEDVLADVAGFVGLVEGVGETLLGDRHLTAHVQEALRETDRVAGDQAAFDELVRVALHEEAVLVGAGLRLVAVDDEVARPDLGRAEAPLDAGRETGAAPAEERALADDVVALLGSLGEGLLESLVAAGRQVAVERVAVLVAEPARDDLGARAVDIARGVGHVFASCHQLSPFVEVSHTGFSVTCSGGTIPAALSGSRC